MFICLTCLYACLPFVQVEDVVDLGDHEGQLADLVAALQEDRGLAEPCPWVAEPVVGAQ